MRHVSLQSIDMINFKSFHLAAIDLQRGPGLRLVFGDNRAKARLGANGAGKSTFISEAPCFALYGRSTGDLRASDLLSTGQKRMSVEVGLLIDGVMKHVKRSYPPERIYINGQQADQRAVDELMGLSRDQFLASVLFGQDRPLFIDLPVPERGDLLDETLGLGFWIRAAELATSRYNAANVEIQKLQQNLARLDGAIAELPDEDELRASVEGFEDERAGQVAAQRVHRKELDTEYRDLRRSLSALEADVGREAVLNDVLGELRERSSELLSGIAVLERDMEQLVEQINFFRESGECPVCKQEITDKFAEEHLGELNREHGEKNLWLESDQHKLAEVKKAVAAVVEEISDLSQKTRDRHRLELAMADKRGQINAVVNRVQLLLDQDNPHEAQLRTVAARRAELKTEIEAKRREESVLSARIDYLDFWRQGFRRVRVYCLGRVLRELEVATMGEARSLGLAGWYIGFAGETQTKSGTSKLGVQAIVREDGVLRNVGTWSPGERQRMRVASSRGLAGLIQRKSGVFYDWETWDEPSAWLSAEGVDDLFESLAECAASRGKSIWVVDPRAGLAHGGFDEIINVVKDDDGSRIEIARGDRAVRVELLSERAGDGGTRIPVGVPTAGDSVGGGGGELAPVRRLRRAAAVQAASPPR